MHPIVSIIVPVYKVELYLHRCVRSILAQTYAHWELILVDDGSPDACPQICDEYADTDQRIRVVHKNNGGLSDARNCGLDMATGEYVMFVDSDDYIHPKMLEAMVGHALSNDADLVQCRYIRGTEERFPDVKEGRVHYFDNHTIFASAMQQVTSWAKLCRRSLWEGIRMPVGQIHEDEATTWKIYYRSSMIVALEAPYYYYYVNPTGIMSTEGRRFNPIFVDIYNERISYFSERGEDLLVRLSRWQFCLPLMYLYLRGNLTRSESSCIRGLLVENIKQFVRVRQVPCAHRWVFAILGVCPPLFRGMCLLLTKARNLFGV